MDQLYGFEVCGYWADRIYFKRGNEKFSITKSLPTPDMRIFLRIPKEECKDAREAIYEHVQSKIWKSDDFDRFMDCVVRDF